MPRRARSTASFLEPAKPKAAKRAPRQKRATLDSISEWPPTGDALQRAAQIAGVELVELPEKERNLLPPWAKVVKYSTGMRNGLHAVWDMRRRRMPHVPMPRGAAKIPIKQGDIVVDVGAYVGGFSVRCALQGAEVFAYEPTPLSAAVLRLSAASMGKPGREGKCITAIEAFVTGEACTPGLLWTAGEGLGLSNSAFKQPRKATATPVDIIAFKDAVKYCNVLKVDVEGTEYDFDLPASIPHTCDRLLLAFHERPEVNWRAEAIRICAELVAGGWQTVSPVDLSLGGSTLNAEGAWIR